VNVLYPFYTRHATPRLWLPPRVREPWIETPTRGSLISHLVLIGAPFSARKERESSSSSDISSSYLQVAVWSSRMPAVPRMVGHSIFIIVRIHPPAGHDDIQRHTGSVCRDSIPNKLSRICTSHSQDPCKLPPLSQACLYNCSGWSSMPRASIRPACSRHASC